MPATEIRLAARPNGWPTLDDFEVAETERPSAGAGQAVLRNLAMSVDPYMRGRMTDRRSYVPPFQIGEPLEGGAIGQVVESNVDSLPVGEVVAHNYGWRDYAVTDGRGLTRIDTDLAPLSAYLGVLGGPGLTAYVGLHDIASFAEGDTVFVSGAAGAVGSVVGQLAKLGGAARVIGSAGSAEKVRYLTEELGFDTGLNYRDAPIAEQLRDATPDGIDVYFDNVGGDHLEAAISRMNDHGRIAACGAISGYNATERPAGPRNMMEIVTRRLRIQGFIVIDHVRRRQAFLDEVGPLVRDGKLRYPETVVDGLRNAPQAFLDMLAGANTGKMIVHIADPE